MWAIVLALRKPAYQGVSMSHRCNSLLPLAFPLLLATHPASAAIEGWYYGLSAGEAQTDFSKAVLDSDTAIFFDAVGTPLISSSSTLEDSDTPWSILFGYQLNPWFAAEVAYLDLGAYPYRFSGTAADTGGPIPASVDFEFKATAITLAAVGVLPINYFLELHGRAGLAFSDTETNLLINLGADSLRNNASASTSDFFYGLGVAVNLGDNWSLRADWQQLKDIGDEDVTLEADFDTVTLSVIYRLGPF